LKIFNTQKSSVWFILSLLFILVNNLTAQTYFFDNYQTTDGLESSKIYTITQTPNGFVWLGTDVGLSRFDGTRFDNFSVKDGMAKGGIRVLFCDKDNNLWIGHEGGGITRMSGSRFEEITSFPVKSNITSITQDPKGQLWMTTYENGALRIPNPNAGVARLKSFQYLGKELSDMVFNSLVSSSGKLFLITDIGIKQYNDNQNKFENFATPNLDTYFQFSVMFEDSKHNIWYGTYNGGLYKQDAQSGTMTYFDIKSGLASNWITSIAEDRYNNIWIGHWDMALRGGLTRIAPDGTFKVFNSQNGLHDNKIWSVFHDMEGNILIGTTEHGLDIFKGESFTNYTTNNGLVNNQVTAINQDNDGNVWIGTNGGISVFNTHEQTFINFDQQHNQISDQIRFLKTDNQQNIWLGTDDQGVQLFDITQRRFVSKPHFNEYLPRVSKSVWAMEIDLDNNLWVGTLSGLIQFDINRDAFYKTYGQLDGLPSNEIKSLHCDRRGTLWVGMKNNGLCYNNNGHFKPFPMNEAVTPTCITSDSRNRIIFGTEAHGVYIIEGDSITQHINIHNGLFNNNIRFVITDRHNNIFVGTTMGLNKIAASGNYVLSFSQRNGFTGIETKPNAAFEDKEGNLWLGTVNGLTCYNPDDASKNITIPITHIINMQVNGETVDFSKETEFPYYKNNVFISFSSIAISNPAGIKYQFMLEGADKEWQSSDGTHSANYRSLAPGKYHFWVKAINELGQSSQNITSVNFTILAPIYKRPWFIVLMIIVVIVSAMVIIKLREQNLIIEKKKLEEKVEERTLELWKANHQLASRNKDITDSITYAKRIQFAILPADIPYPDTFVLFRPKDIVSGDFYWATHHQGKEFLAVIDCTGHGVPGAFMSVIGHISLNKIIIEKGILNPADILTHLNAEVALNLHQKEGDIVTDGMDLALISFDPLTRTMEYAGANNPVWIGRNNTLIEIKASRFAIGRSSGDEKRFMNHQMTLQPNDMIYLFSDGYADQFGGNEGKKFKTSRLRQLFTDIQNLPVNQQLSTLESTLNTWKGPLEQVDDILVVGRRIE
jgi:ligand-binding sensor domain-containing protein/serine phosphatase RsbU (regulator of sigma subunit)